jgi:hypothetical protein
MPTALYDEDFYRWSQETAKALTEGRFAEVDIEHLAEEIRSLGKNEHRELIARLARLMAHMLKIRYQPQQRTRSWDTTIDVQRDNLRDVLDDNPSFAATAALTESVRRAYRRARLYAAQETHLDLDTFPKECPFTLDEVLPPEESK